MRKTTIPSDKLNEKELFQRLSSLCARRECCIRDMEEKMLALGVEEEMQSRIIDRLVQERFVDETRYARAYALDKMRYNHWGRLKIGQMLRMQGISISDRDIALRELPDEEYDDILRRLMESKLPTIKANSDYERRGKLFRYLLGRGFEMSDIERLIDSEF